MNRVLVVAAVALMMIGAGRASANVLVNVDKSSQRMTVSVDGRPAYTFVVSTGRPGYGTPSGVYHPTHLEKQWFSKEYYNSPMPHSIFFHGGYAIHGSYEISRLGGPASHGCIRLHPADAAKLYALVSDEGMNKTTIVVSGQNPRIDRVPTEQATTTPAAPGSSYYQRQQPYQSYYQSYPDYQERRGPPAYQYQEGSRRDQYGRPATDAYGRPLSYRYGQQPHPSDAYAPRQAPENRDWFWGPNGN
jgi:hypothetical protein